MNPTTEGPAALSAKRRFSRYHLVLLALFLGLYTALFAALGARLWRRGDLLSLAALPALWVGLEVARGWLLTGFPWNLAAYAWLAVPGALPLAAWIGAWGVRSRKAFQRPMAEGVKLLNAIQDVYLCKEVTVA